MKVIKGIENLRGQFQNPVLTIGNFDGVHMGHQKIIKRVLEAKKRHRSTAVALTFDPHPIKALYPERGVRILTPTEEKARLMAHYGIDALVLANFDREFASIHPDDFIRRILVEGLGVKEVIVGHNYSFGKGKKGTTALLRRQGAQFGFGVNVVRNAVLYGDVVSSSRIRSLLGRGRVCEASLFLGRPYMIKGIVVKGAGRGARLLGTPTANIATRNELIPREGVYAVKVRLDGAIYGGVANIGRNPTFQPISQKNAEVPPSYEVHILNFSGDILGMSIELFFIDRIRDEKVFPDKDSLAGQIKRDIDRAREILQKKKHLPIV